VHGQCYGHLRWRACGRDLAPHARLCAASALQ
jgi:hypothetical protein